MSDEFSVVQFFVDDSYEYVSRELGGKEAVQLAANLAHSVGGRIGTTRRIIITDGDDCTVFEWKYGDGVTFPPEAVGKV
jgi:hypothetical protein